MENFGRSYSTMDFLFQVVDKAQNKNIIIRIPAAFAAFSLILTFFFFKKTNECNILDSF